VPTTGRDSVTTTNRLFADAVTPLRLSNTSITRVNLDPRLAKQCYKSNERCDSSNSKNGFLSGGISIRLALPVSAVCEENVISKTGNKTAVR